MEAIIFSFLAIVIALGRLWYHDVRHPPEEQAMETRRKQSAMPDSTTDSSKEQLSRSVPAKEIAPTVHAETQEQV